MCCSSTKAECNYPKCRSEEASTGRHLEAYRLVRLHVQVMINHVSGTLQATWRELVSTFISNHCNATFRAERLTLLQLPDRDFHSQVLLFSDREGLFGEESSI